MEKRLRIHAALLLLGLLGCDDERGRRSDLSDNIERTVGDTPESPGLMGGPSRPLREGADAGTEDAGPKAAPDGGALRRKVGGRAL